MKITTTYKTNNAGTGQIMAKGGGKQKTVEYDPAKSVDWNHGNAAGELMLKAFSPEYCDMLTRNMGMFTHTVNDNNSHTFEV